jgi:peptidoglycan/xylan/chitin deacetylase (PgdA/CDA1 family)
MTAKVCFTMDNLGDAADLGRGVITQPRQPGERPALDLGFPALLDLYRRFNITITYFVEGWSAQAYPDLIEQILAEGHNLGMHGWQHELWSTLDYESALDIATRATLAIEKSGARPKAFRAPGGIRTRFTSEIISSLGYTIDSSLCPSGQDGGEVCQLTKNLWSVPWEWVGVDASHWLWQKKNNDQVEMDWRKALDTAAEKNAYMLFIWHPHVMGIKPDRVAIGEKILEYVSGNDKFEIVSLEKLVELSRVS